MSSVERTVGNTVQELRKKIGSVIQFHTRQEGLIVRVKINDVKVAYGQVRYLVSVEGQDSNLVWVNA